MRTRTVLIIGLGAVAAAALAQTGTAPVESKVSPNAQAAPISNAPAPAATTAPGADNRTAPPANGTAPIEPKR